MDDKDVRGKKGRKGYKRGKCKVYGTVLQLTTNDISFCAAMAEARISQLNLFRPGVIFYNSVLVHGFH